MRIFIKFLIFVSFSYEIAFADAPQVIELSSDKQTYAMGEKAVLMTTIVTEPDNQTSEIFLEATVNGHPAKLTKISNVISAAVTQVPSVQGTFDFQVSAYLQDKHFATQISEAIFSLKKEIFDLSEKRKSETDPIKQYYLDQAIARDESDIISLESALIANRLLVETKNLLISVDSTKKQEDRKISHPALVLTTDRVDRVFHLNEHATIIAHIYPNLVDQGAGPQENFVTLEIDGVAVFGSLGESYDHYVFKTNPFDDRDLGNHNVIGTLWIRNKKRADDIQNAITLANIRLSEQIDLRDRTEDLYLKGYYSEEVDDLTKIIDTLYIVLDGLKVSVGDTYITFSVVP